MPIGASNILLLSSNALNGLGSGYTSTT